MSKLYDYSDLKKEVDEYFDNTNDHILNILDNYWEDWKELAHFANMLGINMYRDEEYNAHRGSLCAPIPARYTFSGDYNRMDFTMRDTVTVEGQYCKRYLNRCTISIAKEEMINEVPRVTYSYDINYGGEIAHNASDKAALKLNTLIDFLNLYDAFREYVIRMIKNRIQELIEQHT